MISSNKTVQLRGHSFAIDVSIVAHESLTVTLAGEGSAWRGSFSAQYIEDVTKKTGNFKRFSVFAEMVQAALEGSAPGLALDLISAADLAGTNATTHTLPPVVAHERLYLVVTYAAAFDRVHYPLPIQRVLPLQQQQQLQQQQHSYQQHQQSNQQQQHSNQQQQQQQNIHTDTILALQSQISDLKHEKLNNLTEITRLLKENDKLKHLVKHYKQSKESTSSTISLDSMPDLFRTVLKSIATTPSGSDAFKKALKTLQRLVGKLLEASRDRDVDDAIQSVTAPALSASRPITRPTREKSAGGSKTRTQSPTKATKKRDTTPNSSGYRPVKSRPLGLSNSLNEYTLQRERETSRRSGASAGPSSRNHSRNASVTSSPSYKRFDPTSYVLEKELKLLQKRQASRDGSRGPSRSASVVGALVKDGMTYSRSSSVGSGYGRNSRDGPVREQRERSGSVNSKNGSVKGQQRRGYEIELQERRVKGGGGGGTKKQTSGGLVGSALAGVGSGSTEWKHLRESEEDIDKRLEFLQQYLHTLNQE